MNFYEILKTKKLGRGSPDYWTQLFAEHVGGKGEWKVAELTGTLPMTFRSNGTALIDYRIYGTESGAGVQTENLVEGIIEGANVDGNGKIITNNTYNLAIAAIEKDVEYCTLLITIAAFYSDIPQKGSVSIDGQRVIGLQSFTSPIDGYIAFRIYPNENPMIIKSSTAPDHYIPYGYKLPLTITSGTESKDTDVYIGDSKLGAEEYADYEEQKVYKRTENLFDKDDCGIILVDNQGTMRFGTEIEGLSDGTYTLSFNKTKTYNLYLAARDNEGNYTGIANYVTSPHTFNLADAPAALIVRINRASSPSWEEAGFENIMLIKDSTPPETYIPYIQPTDPPLPLPAIETFKGTNTLDSTETLGEVTIKGQIKPQS